MIQSVDRSWWFGASDSSYIVGNRHTDSFAKWWLVKTGRAAFELSTPAIEAGNAYEHKILEALNVEGLRMDEQIKLPELRLRVNYDGIADDIIYEIKTHRAGKPFKVSKAYWRQAQTEMYAFKESTGVMPKLYIVAYPLTEREYADYDIPIDSTKLDYFEIKYDKKYVSKVFLPGLEELRDIMKEAMNEIKGYKGDGDTEGSQA